MESEAWAINDSDQVVGDSRTVLPGQPWRAFLKNPGQPMEDLGALETAKRSGAYGINASGQVAGTSDNNSLKLRAVFKNPGQPMVDLGTLGGDESFGWAINASGQVVGHADRPDGWRDAFLRNPGQPMQNLATWGGRSSTANAINASGQVVGEADRPDGFVRPFLWEKGTMYDLEALTVNFSLAVHVMVSAKAINDRGWVAVNGQSMVDPNPMRAFLLTPLTLSPGPLILLLE
jgi:probable HAF family extracellular repeat protein